jgi:hypothetical protein
MSEHSWGQGAVRTLGVLEIPFQPHQYGNRTAELEDLPGDAVLLLPLSRAE